MLREALVINHKVLFGKISQQGGGGLSKIKNFPSKGGGGGSENLGTVPK